MKITLVSWVGIGLLLLTSQLQAAPIQVYGPKAFKADPKTASYSQTFTHSKDNADGVITVLNADGIELSLETCPKSPILKRVICELENALKKVAVQVLRPTSIEVMLNNKVLVTSSNLTQQMSKVQLPIKVSKSNTLKIKVKGLWTSYITVGIKAESAAVNQNPLAKFDMTPATGGVAPELISFSALLSSDPDGDAITNYAWEFGDGGVATGAMVSHNFATAGTFAVKLTVTDARGGKGTVVQNVVIRANQVPVARFLSQVDASLGVLKVNFDASGSTDSDGTILEYSWSFGDTQAGVGKMISHTYAVGGTYSVKLIVKDNKGGTSSVTNSVQVLDAVAPILAVTSPTIGQSFTSPGFSVQGTSNEPLSAATAKLGSEAEVALSLSSDKKSFSGSLSSAASGAQILVIKAVDLAGNSSTKSISISFNFSRPPLARLAVTSPSQGAAPLTVMFDASSSQAVQGGALSYKFDFGDGHENASSTNPRATHEFVEPGSYTAKVTVTEMGGQSATAEIQIVAQEIVVPAQPQAPQLSQVFNYPLSENVKFLYQGPSAIQTNMMEGALDETRSAVVRGKVVDESDRPLSGVKVTILEDALIGQTLTRENGEFDIVVNGGGEVTITYERNGYFTIQRKVATQAWDYSIAPTIVMIRPDQKVTTVEMSSGSTQVVQGSTFTDASGSRTGTLLVPAGTTARLELPDGTTRSAASLNIRTTEYTVGDKGPDRMPGPLPPTTSYTYAVDISADEAIALKAKNVVFSNPVPYYVDNFLNFPAGVAVPLGSYDSKMGAWIGEDDGIVMNILSIQNGKAVLDLDGNGSPATATKLSAWNFSDEELTKLAQIYPAGKSLWRVQLKHLTPYDLNWLASVLSVALPQPNPYIPVVNVENARPVCGSIIQLGTLSLGEQVPLLGSDRVLNYSTQFQKGKTTNRRVIIPIQGVNFQTISRINVRVEVAGQVYERNYFSPPTENTDVEWDGLDAYGRKVSTTANATVKITYHYKTSYQISQALPYYASFSASLRDAVVSAVQSRVPEIASQTYSVILGENNIVSPQSIAGWTIDNVHRYEPYAKRLYFGNGELIDGVKNQKIVTTISGNPSGLSGYTPDGSALFAKLDRPGYVRMGSDGNIYFIDGAYAAGPIIRRITKEGQLETLAGNRTRTSNMGGVALQISIGSPAGMAISSDGTVYFTDQASSTIKKLSADGQISVIAGGGSLYNQSNISARQAQLSIPTGLEIASDGTLYFFESGLYKLRKITPNGILLTVAGSGLAANQGSGPIGDGGLALNAALGYIQHIALGPNGDLYVSDSNIRTIRVVRTDGTIHRVAGTLYGAIGDNSGLAVNTQMFRPGPIVVSKDGTLYVHENFYGNLFAVRTDGKIEKVAGDPGFTFPIAQGNTITPDQWNLSVTSIAYYNNDTFVLTEDYNKIRLFSSSLPGYKASGYSIASRDSSEIYLFDSLGKHLKTLFARTGATKWEFAYNNNGFLVSMKDENGLVTEIDRDGNQNPTRMKHPLGQVTSFSVDSNGELTSITNPTGESTTMQYGPRSLLSKFTKPSGKSTSFTYNSKGELASEVDAAGNIRAIRATPYVGFSGGVHTLTTAEGRSSVTTTSEGIHSRQSQTKFSDGTQSLDRDYFISPFSGVQKMVMNENGIYLTGHEVDPRLGGMSRSPTYSQIWERGVAGSIASRTARQSTQYIPLSETDFFKYKQQWVATDEAGNNESTTFFDSTTNTLSQTSTLGQKRLVVFDSKERPIRTQLASFTPVEYTYNSIGLLQKVTQGDRVQQFIYNGVGQMISSVDAEGQTTNYQYDSSNRMIRKSAPDNGETVFSYNQAGIFSGLTPPDRMIHQFARDVFELVASYMPPTLSGLSATTSYQYDRDQRLMRVNLPAGRFNAFNYDPGLSAIKPTAELTSNKSITRTVQTLEGTSGLGAVVLYRTETAQTSDGVKAVYTKTYNFEYRRDYSSPFIARVNYSMNIKGLISQEFLNDSAINFTYNTDDLLTAAGSLALSRNNSTGLLAGDSLGSVTTEYTYSSYAELERKTSKYSSSPILDTFYERDRVGRVVEMTETIQGSSNVYSYRYDANGRLVQALKNGVVNSYAYDRNGNRISKNGIVSTFDAQDRLINSGSAQYSYDAAGVLASKQDSSGATQYQYDDFGQTSKITLPSGKIIEYLIDPELNRAGVKINGVVQKYYVYQQQKRLVAELNADGTLKSRFIYATTSHSPDYMTQGANSYRLVKDSLGSIRLVVNASTGAVAQRLDYDEFGIVVQDTNPGFQPFGFAGGLYDADTKLVRFGARDYDPSIGRWTAKDPIGFAGGDTNLYAYVGGDPVNFMDPLGLAKCTFGSGKLTCTSNDGTKSISLNAFTGAGPVSSENGRIPAGAYQIRKLPDAQYGTWYLDPGLLSRALYRANLDRGGFNLHIPGNSSNGCVTVRRNENSAGDIYNLNQLLTDEIGSNTLTVLPDGN